MKILGLEFSSEQRSAAVWSEGIVSGRAQETGGRSSQAVALIETALGNAKLEREAIECIVIGVGPGSYTGIRAATSVAQGWQLARGINLLAISSVECLAAQARAQGLCGKLHVVIDAQREDLYLATYEITPTGSHEVSALKIVTLAEAHARVGADGVVIGPEASRWFPEGRVMYPDAAMLTAMAAGRTNYISGAQLEPIYLRATSFVKAPPPRVIA